MSGQQKLKILAYSDEEFKSVVGKPYTLMLNPENLKRQQSIEYNSQQAPDSSSSSQKYKSTPSDKLSFDFVIDCTGIVDSKRVNMQEEIDTLEKIVYTYNGKIHRPNFVKLLWGKTFTFKCVLNSLDISYTLFKPDGSPLRAKLSLSFSEYISPSTVKKLDKQESPDVTHMHQMTDGENLPQVCHKIWSDAHYYIEAAKYNRLNKFRNIKGGKDLYFPPITQPA